MRILYFNKYIHDEILSDNVLENCPLVIDGHNFFYNVYEQHKLDFVFGSVCNEYARCLLRRPLNMFKKAKIDCYFVFKGGDLDINEKISRIEPVNFDTEANFNFVPPIFLREVCLQVLEEFGYKYSTSIMETVDDCVALAELLECPVLSTGVGYYFRTVPFVPITTINYSNPNDYIDCKQYELTDFLSLNSLTEEKVAIFVALSDIHLFPPNHFDHLFEKWHVFHLNSTILIKSLLKWLSEHTEEEAIESIKEFLSIESDRKKIMEYTEKILENMRVQQNSVVVDYLYNTDRVLGMSHLDPLWFEKGVAAQKIPIPYINLYKHKFILGSTATEKKDSSDSILLSMDIIIYAYNLLTNFQTTDIFVYQDSVNYIKINTGDTKVKKPIQECRESVFENGWKYVKGLEIMKHFLVEINIDIDSVDLPDDVKMLFIALVYFARKKLQDGVNVDKEIYCFIISYVMLMHTTVCYERSDFYTCRDHEISTHEFNDVRRSCLRKHFICYDDEVKQIYNGVILKPLIELQYCILHINYLNDLCGAPYVPTMYCKTFNGTLIYKLIIDMADCDPNDFIQSLFDKVPSVYKFVDKLINAYQELVAGNIS